ncbi:MAG: hypothetical protein HOO91_09975 [Bacteroidales bacterium]|nr:hypothetical protein [Bacteroidales bacterium]
MSRYRHPIFYDDYPDFLHVFKVNTPTESFNSKIKAFRSMQRGVRDIPFFIG